MCQAITTSLRATATVATLAPRFALIRSAKARSGPVVRAACRAASTSGWRASPGALLGDPAVACSLRAGLAHARVEPEVGDELSGGWEAGDLADCGHHAA